MDSLVCPLCQCAICLPYASDKRRQYYGCQHCQLVFVPPWQRLAAAAERAEYDLHRNDPVDPGYRQFLARLCAPLAARLAPGARGLDFGCGPGPALAGMMREQGFAMENYDIFYARQPQLLAARYDFITATEVFEHLFEPGQVLAQLWRCLNPGGYLGLMTKLLIDRERFARWHYKNDPTHVCFYSRATIAYIAGILDADYELVAADAILLRKPLAPEAAR